MALNTGSSILVKLLSFGVYSGILRDLVISLKCLLNTSATLLSSDTMSFSSMSISFLACFTDLLEKKGPVSFPKVIFLYISCLHIIKIISACFVSYFNTVIPLFTIVVPIKTFS